MPPHPLLSWIRGEGLAMIMMMKTVSPSPGLSFLWHTRNGSIILLLVELVGCKDKVMLRNRQYCMYVCMRVCMCAYAQFTTWILVVSGKHGFLPVPHLPQFFCVCVCAASSLMYIHFHVMLHSLTFWEAFYFLTTLHYYKLKSSQKKFKKF